MTFTGIKGESGDIGPQGRQGLDGIKGKPSTLIKDQNAHKEIYINVDHIFSNSNEKKVIEAILNTETWDQLENQVEMVLLHHMAKKVRAHF